MSKIPEILEDVGLNAAAVAAVSQNVSAIIDSATTAAAAAPVSAAKGTSEEITGLGTASNTMGMLENAITTAAAVSNTVGDMLERATTMAAAVAGAVSEVPVVQTPTPEAASTAVVTTTTIVPPFSPPGLSAEYPMSSIELSGRRDDCGDERGGTENDNLVLELEREGESPRSPTPPQPRKFSAAVDVADRSRKNQRELKPVVISDAGRMFYTDEKLDQNGRDEKEQKDDEQEDKGRGEKQYTQENDAKGERLESQEDCDGRVVLASGPEDGASVWVSGRREGAVVQVR